MTVGKIKVYNTTPNVGKINVDFIILAMLRPYFYAEPMMKNNYSLRNMPKKGKFITFEGGEGVGKSTAADILTKKLTEMNIRCILTREPGGTVLGEQVRKFLKHGERDELTVEDEIKLLFAARFDHLNKVIRPALIQGKWVVCDRFTDSTRAYQGTPEGTLSTDVLIRFLELAIVEDTVPNLTFILTLDDNERYKRITNRDKERKTAKSPVLADNYESRSTGYHQRINDIFLSIAAREPGRCKVIGTNQPLQGIEDEILDVVRRELLP